MEERDKNICKIMDLGYSSEEASQAYGPSHEGECILHYCVLYMHIVILRYET
jgi:hypothetical protein